MATIFFGRLLHVFLSIAQIKLATSILNPDQYGAWTLLISMASLYILIVITPLGLFLNRHLYEWSSKKFIPEVFASYSGVLTIVAILSFFVFYTLTKLSIIPAVHPNAATFSILMASMILSQVLFQTWIPALNILGNKKRFVIGSAISILAGMMASVALTRWFATDAFHWALGMAVGYIFTTFLMVPWSWLKFDKIRFKELKQSINYRQVVSFSFPLVILTILMWCQGQGYRFVIKEKIGLETLGYFTAGYAVVAGMTAALESVLAGFCQPMFYKNISEGSTVDKEMIKMWALVFYPYVLAIAYFVIVGKDIAKIFLAEQYTRDIDWISYAALIEGLRVIFNTISFHLQGEHKTYKLLLPQILGLLAMYLYLSLSNSLDIIHLVYGIALSYIISIILLIGGNISFYFSSEIGKIVGVSLGAALLFSMFKFLSTDVYLISGLGFLFMVPYLIKYRSVLR